MKLSPYVKSVRQALKNKIILTEDVLQMYKDNYLTAKECQQVLEGGNYGRVYNKLSNLR